MLLICDSNNHRIMVLDPFKNEIYPWLGGGEEGLADGRTNESAFSAPEGVVSFVEGDGRMRLFIADTGNNCIRTVDYDDGEVFTLEILEVPLNPHLGSRGD